MPTLMPGLSNLSSKEGSILNPNERKEKQQIKSCVCANRFYENIGGTRMYISYHIPYILYISLHTIYTYSMYRIMCLGVRSL